jgi:hypothetical protein
MNKQRRICKRTCPWDITFISDYKPISRRINRLDITIQNNKSEVFKDDYIIIIIDITGIKSLSQNYLSINNPTIEEL